MNRTHITIINQGVDFIVGYYFGAGNIDHIKRILKIALVSAFITGTICWAVVFFSSTIIAESFSPGNVNITSLAKSEFGIFTAAFLLNGFNILVTAYFTAIGRALVSAIEGVFATRYDKRFR